MKELIKYTQKQRKNKSFRNIVRLINSGKLKLTRKKNVLRVLTDNHLENDHNEESNEYEEEEQPCQHLSHILFFFFPFFVLLNFWDI